MPSALPGGGCRPLGKQAPRAGSPRRDRSRARGLGTRAAPAGRPGGALLRLERAAAHALLPDRATPRARPSCRGVRPAGGVPCRWRGRRYRRVHGRTVRHARRARFRLERAAPRRIRRSGCASPRSSRSASRAARSSASREKYNPHMKSLWSDAEAAKFDGPLGARVYTSRLLGRDKSLVLHGGGNTSVKLREKNLFGEDEEILYVKGSGWDLETIEAPGCTPVALAYVKRLAQLPALSDPQMVNELNTHTLRAGAPSPSVETILHAILPHKYVDHTHADAVLSVSNAPDGEKRVREIYGDRVVIIPYIMAGFDLATYCAREFAKHAGKNTIGMVLLSHGIFSFGKDARESYERMIDLVSMSEEFLQGKGAWRVALKAGAPSSVKREEIATLRRSMSDQAGFPLVLRVSDSAKFLGFAQRRDLEKPSQQGPATPDHVIRTKPFPMLGRDVTGYAKRYGEYFQRFSSDAKEKKTMLDAAPRMALDPTLGFVAAGRTAKDTAIVEELYDHTIDVILRAEALGGWRALDPQHTFDIEYWDLEQAKLRKAGTAPAFAGEVAVVTGAASGIGKACVESFLKRGAAVMALDRNPAVETL